MSHGQHDPLHGITLKMIMTELHDKFGWDGLAARIHVKCFTNNPSIKSSLTFLRRTPWAREQVEDLYLKSKGQSKSQSKEQPITRQPKPGSVWQQANSGASSDFKSKSKPNSKSHPKSNSDSKRSPVKQNKPDNPWLKGRTGSKS